MMFRHHDEPMELLLVPTDVTDWAIKARLVNEPMEVTANDLVRTKELREAIYVLMLNKLSDDPRAPRDVDLLNRRAAGPPLGLALRRGSLHRFGSISQLHSTLARDALELLGVQEVQRLKICAGDDCSRLYFDISRNVTRRWCGMRGCGDKAKAASYRARRRAAEQKDFPHDVH
jgi:predicted RNA-binding Zn ribbon-like protein